MPSIGVKESPVINQDGEWAILRRVSTDEQYEEGESFENQNEKNLELVRSHNGKVYKDYAEEGVSAFRKRIRQRPKILELIRDIEAGKIKYIVSYNRDRIVRLPEDYYMLRGIFEAYGVEAFFTSKNEVPWNPPKKNGRNNPMEQFMSGLRPLLSELECGNTSQRVYDNILPLVQKGIWRCGRPPYGYRYDKNTKRVEQVPHQAEVCKMIRDMYLKGFGAGKIADILNNEKKIPYESPAYWKKSQDKKPRNFWYEGVVTAIVTKPVYCGIQVWDGQWYECPAIDGIFTREEWEEANQVYKAKLNKKTPHKYFSTTFLFKDILRCGICGSRMIPTYKTSKYQTLDGSESVYEYYHYKCEGRWENHNGCKQKKHNRKHIEYAIIQQVADDITTFDVERLYNKFTEQLKRQHRDRIAHVANLERERKELEKNIDRNLEAFQSTASQIVRSQLERKLEQFEQRRIEVEHELEEAVASSPQIEVGKDDFLKVFQSMRGWEGVMNNPNVSREEKRKLAVEVLDSIHVTVTGGLEINFKVAELLQNLECERELA